MIEKRLILLNTEDVTYLLLDGKMIDRVSGGPREILGALERGEYDLPADAYGSLEDVQYINLEEQIQSPEQWYQSQQAASCGGQGGCGGCCGKGEKD